MKLRLLLIGLLAVLLALGPLAAPALAHGPLHDQPDGAEWLMADWMLYSFLIFFGAGLVCFLVALKRGMFNNLEAAKFHVLTIDETDYYTPEWAKEEAHGSTSAERQH